MDDILELITFAGLGVTIGVVFILFPTLLYNRWVNTNARTQFAQLAKTYQLQVNDDNAQWMMTGISATGLYKGKSLQIQIKRAGSFVVHIGNGVSRGNSYITVVQYGQTVNTYPFILTKEKQRKKIEEYIERITQ